MITHKWADFVTAVRTQADMTQAEFAGHTGIPIGTLRHWEQGMSTPCQSAVLLARHIMKGKDAAAKAYIEKL
jgi:DNA-binding transcriptional regulator YiaG